MNDVFLLMWFADFISSIGVIAIICLIGVVGGISFSAFIHATDGGSDYFSVSKKFITAIKYMFIPIVVSVFLPSKTTIQLLAINKASETAINTKLGAKGLEALDAIFDGIIADKKPKK